MARKKQQPGALPQKEMDPDDTLPMETDDPEGRRVTKKVPRLRDTDLLKGWEKTNAAA